MDTTVFENRLKEWRHFLHEHPETAFEEIETAKYIAAALRSMGLDVAEGIGGTGVVATLKVGDSPEVIGLRADMDAINLTEESVHEYKSKNAGKMHACGHDGHVAMLLGAAQRLSESRSFNGTVRFVFQPAEEPGKGTHAMINDGLFEKYPMDEIYGIHNMPGISAGKIVTRTGGIMGSEDNFVIRIKGKGGHASSPHMGIDPLVIAAEIILALQTIVSRSIAPNEAAVISCTELITDGVHNAIPSNVVIKGDTRSYSPEVQRVLEERMRAVCEGICRTHGAECQFEYTNEFLPTLNWQKCVDTAMNAAVKVVGDSNVDSNCKPLMVSEDFGVYLEKIPGCLLFIGNGIESLPLHNSKYDFNDAILTTGAEFLAEIIETRLLR